MKNESEKTKHYVEITSWDWELTKWSQRVLKAGIVGDVISGALITLGITTGNAIALETGLYGATISVPITTIVGLKEKIEADVRRENNLHPSP